MDWKPIKENIAAVVILYCPDNSFIENISSYIDHVAKVYVIDNTPVGANSRYSDRLCKIKALEYVILGGNAGIAAALNIGVKKAQKAGYHWIATFDQDSAVTEGYFQAIADVFQAEPDKKHVAIIAPRYVEFEEVCKSLIEYPEQYCAVEAAITSGNLVNIEAWEKIGGYDEALFIDYVDHDFCLKCCDNGFKVLQSNRAILQHALGAPSGTRVFLRTVKVTNHNHIRRYYNARNRIVVYRRHFSRHKRWVVADLKSFVKELIKLVVFEKDSFLKMCCVIKGVLDGIRGRLGKYS